MLGTGSWGRARADYVLDRYTFGARSNGALDAALSRSAGEGTGEGRCLNAGSTCHGYGSMSWSLLPYSPHVHLAMGAAAPVQEPPHPNPLPEGEGARAAADYVLDRYNSCARSNGTLDAALSRIAGEGTGEGRCSNASSMSTALIGKLAVAADEFNVHCTAATTALRRCPASCRTRCGSTITVRSCPSRAPIRPRAPAARRSCRRPSGRCGPPRPPCGRSPRLARRRPKA